MLEVIAGTGAASPENGSTPELRDAILLGCGVRSESNPAKGSLTLLDEVGWVVSKPNRSKSDFFAPPDVGWGGL